ncbi:MAG: hypothetical protein ACI4KF_13450 [Huintestinicola sp.]
MEKKIEITITQESTKVDLKNTSNREVALALCHGVFNVCRECKIPIKVVTDVLNSADSFMSKVVERDKPENKSDHDKISDLIDALKSKNMPLDDIAALAAILAIHDARNR